MALNVKNGTLRFSDAQMSYIRFGGGERILVILPGLGDGLRTVDGTALPMSLMYHAWGKTHTVYGFSRRNDLPRGYTTRDMARDTAEAMEALGIQRADIFGVSMGGMIAQHLAIDYPEKVDKLILAVTTAKANPILTESVQEWISLAKAGDHTAFMRSNLRRIYSEGYCRRNERAVPLVAAITKPSSYERFLIQADACLTHDAREGLCSIQAPTLVIGGEKDLTLGADASREIVAAIPGAQLKMYPQGGHGIYEEEKTFNRVVLEFLTGKA